MKKKLSVIAVLLTLAFGLMACGTKTYTVVLTDVGNTPIKLIKAVQEENDLSVKDAKALVDNLPSVIGKDLTKEEAETLKAKLEEASGTVEIK